MTAAGPSVAFLFDVDNTLLDNDRVRRDLSAAIAGAVGPDRGAHFWELYEDIRRECDYVDFPHTLERFTLTYPEEPGFPALADAVLSYPYRSAAFPGAHDVLRRAGSVGRAAILSDGDPVYQPAKIARAGFAEEVGGRVYVFAHKEDHLAEVQRRLPADLYVLVDDKPRILAAAKDRLGDRLITLHVCQGRYAHAAEHDAFPAADRSVDAIADILALDLTTLLEYSR
ncbi:MAG: HAD family hydrolase [Chloroflexota bacterium]